MRYENGTATETWPGEARYVELADEASRIRDRIRREWGPGLIQAPEVDRLNARRREIDAEIHAVWDAGHP